VCICIFITSIGTLILTSYTRLFMRLQDSIVSVGRAASTLSWFLVLATPLTTIIRWFSVCTSHKHVHIVRVPAAKWQKRHNGAGWDSLEFAMNFQTSCERVLAVPVSKVQSSAMVSKALISKWTIQQHSCNLLYEMLIHALGMTVAYLPRWEWSHHTTHTNTHCHLTKSWI